jgi:hypothetical protein
MVSVVSNIGSSGILHGNITSEGCNSILKSIQKLTLFLLRVIIIKNSLPVNPYDLTEIKAKRNLYQLKSSICDDLLNSIEDIKFCDSREQCPTVELKKCLVRVITQFNSTITILTGINYPFVTLPKESLFGRVPLIRRLEYSAYIFLLNLDTTLTMGLIKFMILIMRGPESIYLQFYNLFASSSNLIKNTNDESENADTFQHRQSWLKLYRKCLKPWEYDITRE